MLGKIRKIRRVRRLAFTRRSGFKLLKNMVNLAELSILRTKECVACAKKIWPFVSASTARMKTLNISALIASRAITPEVPERGTTGRE